MKDIEYNYYPLSIRVSQNEKDPQYNVPAEVLNLSNIIPSANGSILASGTIQSPNFSQGNSGWIIKANGDVEFGSGKFRGDITGASGTFSGTITATAGSIGGFTITATELYGGIIKTAATVGAGTTGVIMDTAGLRGYDSVLGNTFNLPTNGSAPTFSSGIINSTIFEINTNAVMRTSATVGDGTASSAGILINNTGLYACQASQTLANANVKILINGSGYFSGTITSSTITGGTFQTSDSRQRITITAADNYLRIYNADNQIGALGGSTDGTGRYFDLTMPTNVDLEMVRFIAQKTDGTEFILKTISKGYQSIRLSNENTNAYRNTNNVPILDIFQLGTGTGINIGSSSSYDNLPLKVVNGRATETNFNRQAVFGTMTIYTSDGTTPDGNLTGVVGDICFNGAGGLAYYCDAAGKNWTAM